MSVNIARYECTVCHKIFAESQLLGDEVNKICGDASCEGNIRLVNEEPVGDPDYAHDETLDTIGSFFAGKD